MTAWKTLVGASALAAGMALAGCDGSHGFEGQYKAIPSPEQKQVFEMFSGSEMTSGMAQQVMAQYDNVEAEIGQNYILFDGTRVEFDRIFVREQGEKSFLVLDEGDGVEEAVPIVDAKKKVIGIDGDVHLVWEAPL